MPENYCRYAYFIKPEKLAEIELRLKAGTGKPYRARRMVCELLHPKREGGIAFPDAWDKNCRRQGSWYRASEHNGEVLVVTNSPLEGRRGLKIAPIDFQLDRRPSSEDIKALAESPAYRQQEPPAWQDIDDFDREQFRLFRQGLLKLGLASREEAEEKFESAFPGHCANHANFIQPRFFQEREGKIVPYSIGSTLRVCSACVELFGLLGNQFDEKLVVLCPGAVLTTGLPRNQYFSVTKHELAR
jgi:hypothetical protein